MTHPTGSYPALSDKSTIRIQISFLVTGIIALVSLVSIFLTLRSDVVTMLNTIENHDRKIQEFQLSIMDMKYKMESIDTKITTFKDTYERDKKFR